MLCAPSFTSFNKSFFSGAQIDINFILHVRSIYGTLFFVLLQELEGRVLDTREQERMAREEGASLYSQLQQVRVSVSVCLCLCICISVSSYLSVPLWICLLSLAVTFSVCPSLHPFALVLVKNGLLFSGKRCSYWCTEGVTRTDPVSHGQPLKPRFRFVLLSFLFCFLFLCHLPPAPPPPFVFSS